MTEQNIKFMRQGWLKSNLRYLAIGLLTGIMLALLISAFKGKWIGFKDFTFELLFSVVITLGVTNSILISQKLLAFNKGKTWFIILVYYLASIVGMLIAIELIYLIQARIFDLPYHFFHPQDALFSALIVLIICTISYVYHAQKESLNARLKEKDLTMLRLNQMKTQAELATLQSKINPHFLYNSLNAIASLIHEDPDKAESMTLKLSKLFRYSINQNQDDLVQVQEELEILSTYLDIEKVRFGERINFRIKVDEQLETAKIPRFLIQPLVENALKHGLNNVTDHGELCVEIKKTDQIVISISDNGIPFPEELGIGYGLQSTYDKLNLLYPNAYEVQILNQPLKQITIQIPLNHG